MANKYVQYGATVAVGVGAVAVTKGIAAGVARTSYLNTVLESPLQNASFVSSSAIDAGLQGAKDAALGAVTNPQFLTGVGLGLVGLALGSGSKRPSLNFPNLAGIAAVALNVQGLLQQSKAAIAATQTRSGGMDPVQQIALRGGLRDDPTMKTSESRSGRRTYQMIYPNDLTENYFIKLELFRYERLDPANKALRSDTPHTLIKLPIPTNLIDAISLAYQDVALGQFQGAAFSNFMTRINGPQAAGNGQGDVMRYATAGVGSLVDAAKDPDFFQAISRKIISNISPEGGSMFDLATGTAPNPHMAVSFQGVALKKYQFSWRLSPNNKEESKILEDIIRNLQASGLPSVQGQFLLTFPDVVKVSIKPSNLFFFKPMMMENVSVNYAPSGSPSFYKSDDNTDSRYPTEIELSISLREIDIHTASDPGYKNIRGQQQVNIDFENSLSPGESFVNE